MPKKAVTLYLEAESYEALKKLVYPKPVSREVDVLIKQRIAELREAGYTPEPVDYEALKEEYYKLSKQMDQLRKTLTKQGFFEKLASTALELGFNQRDFSNVTETSARMLKEWKGPREPLHLFISFLEAGRDKKKIEKQLEEIRLKGTA